MAHFAEIDENNKVIRVLVVPDEQEHRGQEYLANDLKLGGTWVQTSYNGNIRENFAGIGMKFHPDLDAFVHPSPFPDWTIDSIEKRYLPEQWQPVVNYKSGDIVWYGNKNRLYQVIEGKGHTSQVGWEPDIATSVWKIYQFNEDWSPPTWIQPQGSHDAYPDGYIVEYNGKFWRSNDPANVWQPSEDTLWTEVEWNDVLFEWVEITGTIEQWVQPKGVQDAYNIGDIVLYNGEEWISKIDGNTTVPDADEPLNRYWEPHISN